VCQAFNGSPPFEIQLLATTFDHFGRLFVSWAGSIRQMT
jgi:hypothetical protein